LAARLYAPQVPYRFNWVRVGQGKGNWKDKRGEGRERCEQEKERRDGGEGMEGGGK